MTFNDAGVTLRSDNNVVEGCFIGVDPTGTTEHPNFSGGALVATGANNLIGGTTPSARNVISGNTFNGNVIIQQYLARANPRLWERSCEAITSVIIRPVRPRFIIRHSKMYSVLPSVWNQHRHWRI